MRFLPTLLVLVLAASLPLTACDLVQSDNEPNGTDDGGGDGGNGTDTTDPEHRRLGTVETDLLSLINQERAQASPTRPNLQRDPGMDRIMLWHVSGMADGHFLGHEDPNGRRPQGRATYYGDNPAVRCSEIVQWWGGTPSGQVHYTGYFNSPDHHSAYMEEGIFNLGPTTWTGIAAVQGTGPAGSQYEGRSGSYTGLMFCDVPITLAIDPFEE